MEKIKPLPAKLLAEVKRGFPDQYTDLEGKSWYISPYSVELRGREGQYRLLVSTEQGEWGKTVKRMRREEEIREAFVNPRSGTPRGRRT